MTANKHTPGPWVILPEEVNRNYIRVRGTQLGMRYKVANVPTPVQGLEREAGETRANARLIAAAPALLKALERIARPHDCGCKPCTSTCRNQIALEIAVEEMQELARAAIAKATGSAA